MKIRRSLPPAPKIDRIALGAERWARLIHAMPPEFAAAMATHVSRFDDGSARENAKSTFRVSQAAGMVNAREMITAIDTLATWEGAEPGHKCAVLVAIVEISGGRNKDDALRVLARKEYA
jgi:hypothetical protein